MLWLLTDGVVRPVTDIYNVNEGEDVKVCFSSNTSENNTFKILTRDLTAVGKCILHTM